MMMKEDIKKFERLKKIAEISILPSLSPILNLSSAKIAGVRTIPKKL